MPPPLVPNYNREDALVDMEFFKEYEPYRMKWDQLRAMAAASSRARAADTYAGIQRGVIGKRNKEYHSKNRDRVLCQRVLKKLTREGYKRVPMQAIGKYKIFRDVAGVWYSEVFPDIHVDPLPNNVARIVQNRSDEPAAELTMEDLL